MQSIYKKQNIDYIPSSKGTKLGVYKHEQTNLGTGNLNCVENCFVVLKQTTF